MNRTYNISRNDNVATSIILAAGLLAAATGVFAKPAAVSQPAVQRMDTIVVTAKRGVDTRLVTIVVRASRNLSQA